MVRLRARRECGSVDHMPESRSLSLQGPISKTALIAYLSRAACASSERAEKMRGMASVCTDPVMARFLRLQAEYHQTDNSALRMLEAAVESEALEEPTKRPIKRPWWRAIVWWVR